MRYYGFPDYIQTRTAEIAYLNECCNRGLPGKFRAYEISQRAIEARMIREPRSYIKGTK